MKKKTAGEQVSVFSGKKLGKKVKGNYLLMASVVGWLLTEGFY